MMESGHKLKENHSENDGKDIKIAETGQFENGRWVEKTKTNSEIVAQNNLKENEAQDVKATANGAKDVKVTVAGSENGAQNDKLTKTNAETGAQDVKLTETHSKSGVQDNKITKSEEKSITQNIQVTNTNQAHEAKTMHVDSENDAKDNMKVTDAYSENASQNGKIIKNNAGDKDVKINSRTTSEENVRKTETHSEIGAQDVKTIMGNQAIKPTNANSGNNPAEGVKVTKTHSEIGAQDVKVTKDNQANKLTNANSGNNAAEGVKVTETHSQIGAQDAKAAKDNQANKPTNANSGNDVAEDVKFTKTHSGHSVQVVKITETHSYELDEHALQQILMKEEIKDLPMVVVSIAGATRSGKSFILNFFLRYLTAPQSARDDGSWLGEESAPLVGFKWRSGSKRTTLGILLWSEPFILTRPSGEKVAVFLLDTQGTFDNTSTVNDCSTVFALSTLISSVQIYNLFLDIHEDNLQFLQLFTDYGRMVKDQDSKAFQVLQFLVRDWQYPWEHPFGAVGGEQILEQKLEVLPNQTKDMQDLRRNIRSSFEKVSCFLMPHPGYEIFDSDHKGNISAIRKEFRTSVTDLVTSLLSSEKLMPKTINGEQVKPRDLFSYFKTYMTVFKSNEIPTLTSVYQAMVNANLLTIMNEASEAYKTGMDSECGPKHRSMPADDVHVLHLKYSDLARKTFTSKKKMGTKQDADKYLDQLMVDLERWLPQFEQGNLAKTQTLIKKANESYEKGVQIFGKIETLCVHPAHLNVVHRAGLGAALKTFDEGRKRITTKEDDKRTEFIISLNTSQATTLEQPNQRNNDLAVSQVHLQYVKRMTSKIESIVLLSEEKFTSEHNDEKRQAIEQLNAMRSKPSEESSEDFLPAVLFEDVYEDKLIKVISNSFIELNELNNRKNKSAIAAAAHEYDTYINKCLGDNFCCHNLYMEDTVVGGVKHVLEKYQPYEISRFESHKNDYTGTKLYSLKFFYEDCKDIIGNLIVPLIEKGINLVNRNDTKNRSNVEKALKLYTDTMYSEYHFWYFASTVYSIHNKTEEKAFQAFFNMRTDFTKGHANSDKRERMEDLTMGQYSDYFFEMLKDDIRRHYEKEYL